MRLTRCVLPGILCACLLGCASLGSTGSTPTPFAAHERLTVISTRPGVTLPFVLVEPSTPPVGSVILLGGGDGVLGLSPDGFSGSTEGLLVRTRHRFARAGLVVAVLDAPSDRRQGLDGFRTAMAHARDVRTLISWLDEKWHVPVFLVGASRGAISAANALARGPGARVAGVVLVSSVTAGRKESLGDVALERHQVPVHVVHHTHDACDVSPPAGARTLRQRLGGAAELALFDGGDAPEWRRPCGPHSHHGFFGVESPMVASIIRWMKAHPAGPLK
jgi:hypothetical protein